MYLFVSWLVVCLLTVSFQSSSDAPYIARHVGLRCGVPIPVPALTVNRLCGSGFQAVITGAQVKTPTQTKVVVDTAVERVKCIISSGVFYINTKWRNIKNTSQPFTLCVCRRFAWRSRRWCCVEVQRIWARLRTLLATYASEQSSDSI